MKKIFLLILMLLLILAGSTLYPCHVFKIAHQNQVYAGNNEDYNNPLTYIHFFPAEKGKLGRVYLGYCFNPIQGGMNEKGLFFDWVAGYRTDWKTSADKQNYQGNLNEKIMEECATVEEAISLYKKYNKSSFKYARTLLADSSGASAIVLWKDGKLTFLRDQGGIQAVGYNETEALSRLKEIKKQKKISVDDAKNVLKIARQEGAYPTVYSNICDLKNKIIHLYLFHHFNHVVSFDLAKELAKGEKKYRISSLFPSIPAAAAYDKNFKEALLKNYARIKQIDDDTPVGQRELLLLGLRLTEYNEMDKAVEILKLNAEVYSGSWMAFDNLGYVYKLANKKDLALKAYKRSLELNRENKLAADEIKKLEAEK